MLAMVQAMPDLSGLIDVVTPILYARQIASGEWRPDLQYKLDASSLRMGAEVADAIWGNGGIDGGIDGVDNGNGHRRLFPLLGFRVVDYRIDPDGDGPLEKQDQLLLLDKETMQAQITGMLDGEWSEYIRAIGYWDGPNAFLGNKDDGAFNQSAVGGLSPYFLDRMHETQPLPSHCWSPGWSSSGNEGESQSCTLVPPVHLPNGGCLQVKSDGAACPTPRKCRGKRCTLVQL